MKKITYLILIGTLLILVVLKKSPYMPPENIVELEAGDSLKVWKLAKRYNGRTRMNMGDRFLGYRQTFSKAGRVYDNNKSR